MPATLISPVALVTLDRVLSDHAVLLVDSVIDRVGPAAAFDRTAADVVVDGGHGLLTAGFIDLHIHGTHRYLIDNGADDLAALCGVLPRYGVTGFLPTVCPLPKGEDAAFVASLAAVDAAGAAILGFHLEGPFLTLTGALPPAAIGSADAARVNALIAACGARRSIFSIAPDFDGIERLLPLMAANGTPVFMTHTQADVAQTQAAIALGVRHATHFYDVFPVPAETEPGARPCGAVEAVLADPRVSVDFILDGVHVDPVAVQMALQCKGADRVCLITDANVGAGLPPGRYRFAGGMEVDFEDNGSPARLTEKSHSPGALAGSGLTMDRAVRNAVELLGVELPQALRMAAANPAQVLQLQRHKGRVRPGFDADVVLLDRHLRVQRTWVAGRQVYRAE